MIGRVKSDLFTFTNGYIYYNNCVVKIRYDVLDEPENFLITEDQLFDTFNGIFLQEPDESTETPLDSK